MNLIEIFYRVVHELLMKRSINGKITPSQGWISKFLERNKKQLSKRKSQSLSLVRVHGMSRAKLNGFYDILEDVFQVYIDNYK